MAPTLADLRRIFYGAGSESISDAEYAFLEQAYADGIDAYDLLQLIADGPATLDQLNQAIQNTYRNLGGIDGQVATMPRRIASNGAIPVTSGHVRLNYFTPDINLLVGNIRVLTGGTAAAATPTLIRFGVYSVAANGDLTLIGSTPNDTALLAVINTAYTKPVSAPFTINKNSLYALAVLVVTGAAMPSFVGVSAAGNNTTESALKPRSSAALTGQVDLPASILDSALTGSGNALYGVCTA